MKYPQKIKIDGLNELLGEIKTRDKSKIIIYVTNDKNSYQRWLMRDMNPELLHQRTYSGPVVIGISEMTAKEKREYDRIAELLETAKSLALYEATRTVLNSMLKDD